MLTGKEEQIINTEYEKHKYDNMCPHTTNPRQIKSLCQRCRKLDILNINVYLMPSKLGGDWAASSAGFISDGFKSRSEAEEWALTKAYPIKDKQGNRYRMLRNKSKGEKGKMGFYIEVPDNKGKAKQLVELYGAEVLPNAPEGYWMHDPTQALICVVDNGLFEAAGLCYDNQEFQDFKRPDGRPKTWLLMNRSLAWKLTDFREEYIRG